MIFQVDAKQIKELDSAQLVDLVRRLLLAEAHQCEIPLRGVSVPMQITVPDGGEDGRIEWDGGVDSTNYLPGRFCCFQMKAQKLSGSSLHNEVLKDTASGKVLSTAIQEVLAKGGSYILVGSHPHGTKLKAFGKRPERLRRHAAKRQAPAIRPLTRQGLT